ncbi:MAG: methionyl-tRNA formyltransferase [Clostridia bacterium]|nr:methionyl-tRNA formyltransferase [Clostridia bacterium]
MRVVFMGTPEYGVPSLKALIENGYEVVGVFCQPDKPSGRGKKITFCPVKEEALKHGIPVYQPIRTRVDGVEPLKALAPDLCVTAAFGHILSQEVLDIPRLGTVNVHASLLPKYRGSAPANWVLINGEKETGVTTMLTDKGLDTGDILMMESTPIGPEDTVQSLTERLAEIGAQLLIKTLKAIENGNCPRVKQDEAASSYYPMLKKDMSPLDFNMPAEVLANRVRGLNPWPGTTVGQMKVLTAEAVAWEGNEQPGTVVVSDVKKGLWVKAGSGALNLKRVQLPGGKPLNAADYLRGHKIETGVSLMTEENHG